MYTLFWNILAIGSVGLISYGCISLYDKKLADKIVNTITWNSVKGYHYVRVQCNKNIKKLNDISSNKIMKNKTNYVINSNIKITPKNDKKFIGYRLKDDSVFEKHLTGIENDCYFLDTDFDLMMIMEEVDTKEHYLIIKDKNDIFNEIKPIEKPFLQVELEQNENKMEIHDNLDKFYMDTSEILSKPFLKWYLPRYYKTMLEENYNLHFIDSNINIFSCNSDNFILLTGNDDKYTLKQE